VGDTTRNETLVSVSAQGYLDKNTATVYRSGTQIGDRFAFSVATVMLLTHMSST
jgi:thiamine monophosphate kinase